ncbi:leucine-rich repeat and IQ domain-containing protein 1 isoform X2 [Siniperca chuatsi]|uniref:leucine-rich repeat and IQ domain-containing protein 1 isoform X2 n=1 Tax=Siniperca chuatsi TaxID=119488 RepID=UPI001CE1EBD5|nr:leucine-rich repeat and IQ domain-containing protein 1 isoform X2 [Siniperca chuatsi]
MTDDNEMYDTIMRELNNLVISDTDETKEEQESLSLDEGADFNDIPPSLLSYFETSRSRAAVCEKLILEELEDFSASHHTEDMMKLPIDLDKDMMKLNEQATCDTQNEEKNTSTDTCLLPAPTETQALFIHNVSLCPNNKDEAGTDEYMESEKHLALEVKTLESSLNEEERKKRSEYEAEQEKRHCEEMKKKEQKRQIERDFQKELKKIMEAEKLHQKELELMQKRAQEKLEQELLLQQELISNLKRRVEEERRMREEEQKRMMDEEAKRKREEEKMKIEAERNRMEEETRRKKEEERQIEDMKLKKEEERKKEEEERKKEEEERKKEEEEKRRMEREEKRKREEERNKIDLEKKKLEDEMRMMKEEEEVKRIKKEGEGKREEERKKIEEARKKMEKEKRKMEEEMSLKKEEERRKREEENMRIEEEGRITKEIEERKKQVEMRKKKEEAEADDRKKMYEEMRKRDKREHGNVDEEIKLEERKKREEEEEKEDARKWEKERKKMEEKREVKEVARKKEGENRKMNEELRPIEEDEKRKREDERKTKEEERRRRQKEEMRRQRDKEDCRKSEEEIRLKEDKEGYKGYDVDNRKMEHERKTKDKEKKQEEKRKKEEEIINVEAEKEQNGEEVGENKKEVNKKTEEEIRLNEKEESKKREDREKKVSVVRANELQEKIKKREHNSMIDQNEKKNIDKAQRSLASQLEDSPTWTSSNPGSLHSESTICPSSTETMPQQHDPDKNITQASIDKTVDCQNQAARPSTVCLPEHTEQKRLSWMKDCIPWSKLSLQNRRKQKGSVQSRRGPRRPAEASSLPPLCPDSLLQSTGWKSLQEVTTVTLQDLPGCSLSTLAQCIQLRSLTLRRCGLKSLEGINQLPQLCYIDVQENDISFVDCENMTNLRVLQLGHNKLTSIHGLTGAENLDVLDLSHNSITRIAGLESMKRLQRLSVDHNQLISTKGLRDVYTLLHLSCSHNHLASVEGLENSALLNTLDLRANSLTEPPSLNNQVLLRELHLDDNSISSLTALNACWLPLMQHLSVAQNRITQLPSMSDSVSLAYLDLRFNCMSELQNVCESLEGCQFLREVHLIGNPFQQESGWRSTLQKAVPGLRVIDDQQTDSFLSPPAVQQVSLAVGSFLMFCQAQLQQTHDLQQQHSRELSASSSLDAVKTSCRHFTEALQLAKDQRFAHEYSETTVTDKHRAVGQTTPEETLDMDSTNVEKRTEHPEMESTGKVPPDIRCNYWTFEKKSVAESRHDTVTTGPKTGPAVSKVYSGSVHSLATKGKTISSNLEMEPISNHQDLDLQNTAAVVIQQLWRKCRQKCGNISSPFTAEKGGGRGGDGGKPESGPSYINGSQDYAATVIQAFWRGFTLRRRLASALAAVTCLDTGEDDTFEEVDMDEFVFDEAALEKHWTLPLSEYLPPRSYPESEQPLSLKPPGPFPEPSQYILPPPLEWRSKQAWVAGEQVDSASPLSSLRSKSPASTSVVSGLSERSEKILEEWGFTHSHTALQMLKRAQKMKSKKQQQKKHRDPSVRLALFRNCSYQLGPVEVQNRQGQQNRNYIKVREAELGLQQAEKTEREKQERAQQWLHTQAAHSDRDSESMHFLPEISSDILNGGRVQLVADPGYTERLHHASGLRANNSLAIQPCKEDNYPRRNSLGHATKEVPSPKRVTSAPSKKERISFRDNPVQLSGGWGGGKKRDRVYK